VLLPLPREPHELAVWKIATVTFNYHIGVDEQFYSVPFEFIKRKVDVRLTRNVVEVFFEGNRICSHVRLHGRRGQYSTQEAHMPPDHQKYTQWNGERFRKWAAKTGPNAATVVEGILTGYKVEQQGYRACMALLKLGDQYSPERLEVMLQYQYRVADVLANDSSNDFILWFLLRGRCRENAKQKRGHEEDREKTLGPNSLFHCSSSLSYFRSCFCWPVLQELLLPLFVSVSITLILSNAR